MQYNQPHQRVPRAVLIPTVLGVGALAFVGLRGNAGQQNVTPPVQPSSQVLSIQDAFEQVAAKLRPSVVSITSRQTINGPTLRQGADENDNPFNGFQFPNLPGGGRQFRMAPNAPQFPRRMEASGSGVIVRSDGYILTNDHVVADADRVTVSLLDGRQFVGKVFRDKSSDLALVKIDADNLPAAQLADSDTAKIGQWAIAFGSPFALSDTMTVGVVSSLHRSERIGGAGDMRFYPSLIQTDASINPGNSGGPLVDVYGRVVGINVAIESPSGGNVGIGFAIPANTARYIMDQLISKGAVTRGYLGLVPEQLSFEAQKRYGVKQGALISTVVDGTPAAKSGFQVEDVVTQFNGKPVTDEATFRDLVARTTPGTTVPVVVRRDGGDRTLSVTVGKLPEVASAAPEQAPAHEKVKGKLGVSIGDAGSDDVRKQLDLPEDVKSGAAIVDVVQGSPAFEAGLQKGDVIVKLNGKAITSAQQLSDIASALPAGSSVPVIYRRGGDKQHTIGTQTMLATINLD